MNGLPDDRFPDDLGDLPIELQIKYRYLHKVDAKTLRRLLLRLALNNLQQQQTLNYAESELAHLCDRVRDLTATNQELYQELIKAKGLQIKEPVLPAIAPQYQVSRFNSSTEDFTEW